MQTLLKKCTALLLAALFAASLTSCARKDTQEPLPPQQGSVDEGGNYKPSVPDVSKELKAAQSKNAEAVAWLQIPNTTVNEVVVQTTNNDYYLRRNAEKNYAYEGSYYLDYESVMFDDGADLARNTILYGHNLGNPMGVRDDPEGVKFAQLLKFNDEEMAKKTPYIYFTTESKTHIFEIFAVLYCEAETKPVPYHYADYSGEQFLELAADMKKRSIYTYDVPIDENDKILTLSTCTYKYGTYTQNPDQRYIVMARLVRPNEPYTETAKLTVNKSPKAPAFS